MSRQWLACIRCEGSGSLPVEGGGRMCPACMGERGFWSGSASACYCGAPKRKGSALCSYHDAKEGRDEENLARRRGLL